MTALIITVGVVRICEAQAPALDVVLDRLGAYLLDYETKVVELAAEERYKQWVKRRSGTAATRFLDVNSGLRIFWCASPMVRRGSAFVM